MNEPKTKSVGLSKTGYRYLPKLTVVVAEEEKEMGQFFVYVVVIITVRE